MARVLVFSDLHVDYAANMTHMLSLSNSDYVDDTLVIAGDVSDSLDRLQQLFEGLLNKFATVCFVPGNHELWLRENTFNNSIIKFNEIIRLCQNLGIQTKPYKIAGHNSVWLVPLFSWYRLPEQGESTLYIEKLSEDDSQFGWIDFKLCVWPQAVPQFSPADYFAALNTTNVARSYDAQVISFSHFLPRRDLIFEQVAMAELYADGKTPMAPHPLDPHPYFNFSRVAGDQEIERQVRQLNSSIHVYGHQHRKRDRTVEGIRYVSHCLGNHHERKFLSAADLFPKCIWES